MNPLLILLYYLVSISTLVAKPLSEYQFPPLETEHSETNTRHSYQFPPLEQESEQEHASYYQTPAFRFPQQEQARHLPAHEHAPVTQAPIQDNYDNSRYYEVQRNIPVVPYTPGYYYDYYNPYHRLSFIDQIYRPYDSPYSTPYNNTYFDPLTNWNLPFFPYGSGYSPYSTFWNPFGMNNLFGGNWFGGREEKGLRKPGFFSGLKF